MSTSGSYSFTLAKSAIIQRAFSEIGNYSLSDVIETGDYNFASDKLNMLIKFWEADGVKLWKRRQATLLPQPNQYSYQLGAVSGADIAVNAYVNTTLTTAGSAGNTTINVASITGFTNGMNIGIELTSGTRQWTTVSGTPSGTTITLTAALTGAAASGNTIIGYTSLINRPLRVLRATSYNIKQGQYEVPLMDISYDEYFNIPVKTSAGTPNNFYYDKVLNNTIPNTGTLYMFPCPQFSYILINFTYYDSIQDMINTTDNADFPQEWLYPLVFNLACELAYSYGKLDALQILQPKADNLYTRVKLFDSDDADLQISQDIWGMRFRYPGSY